MSGYLVRLQGANPDIAKDIIDEFGLEVHFAILLKEAVESVKGVGYKRKQNLCLLE